MTSRTAHSALAVHGRKTASLPSICRFAIDERMLCKWQDRPQAAPEYPGATVAVRSAIVEFGGGSRRQFVVCGTGGTFDIHPLEPAHARLALGAPCGEYKAGYQDVSLPPVHGRYGGDFADMARVIRGEIEFGFSAARDLAFRETLLLASGLPIS